MSSAAPIAAPVVAPDVVVDGFVAPDVVVDGIRFTTFQGEHQLDALRALIDKDLSEPYSVFTYRYFLNTWPYLCLLVRTKMLMIAIRSMRQSC
jgi:hypothetical protein